MAAFSTALSGFRFSLQITESSAPMLNLTMGGLTIFALIRFYARRLDE